MEKVEHSWPKKDAFKFFSYTVTGISSIESVTKSLILQLCFLFSYF